jgi:D-alanyl-D-alanine carboxypeptidase
LSLFLAGLLASGEGHDQSFRVQMAARDVADSRFWRPVWAGGDARAASLVIDVESGQVISSDAPNHLWYPRRSPR